ncbi:hypothetical protein N8I77_004457 [Diaporthe amygdali]|uniref:Uncharacterized protein n=1 Tax=Phomopsis amygdali TaxID=1214568 RepID=A0AAD9W704_PHOAM|nr:hypothetical protein N8I77_004457 [Diaporthe amygdali]
MGDTARGCNSSVAKATKDANSEDTPAPQQTSHSTITLRQSIFPVCLVTVLFFLWGFAYGLLDVLNAKFQTALNITAAKAGGLQASYFGAYLIVRDPINFVTTHICVVLRSTDNAGRKAPLTFSGWIVRKFGYKWTFITGLCIYGVGSLMFWPSAVYKSFHGFCGSLFIVGSGLSTLETSANPYIATCGPPRLSELRLEISQSFQAIGSVVAPLLASKLFFKDANINDLGHVQWTYVGIAAFVFLLSAVFLFSPIPETSDDDMAIVDLTGYVERPLWKQHKLILGVIAVFFNAGAQVSIAFQFISYSVESSGLSHSVASDRYAIAQALFAVGRFVAAGLFMIMAPRKVLLVFVGLIMVFNACAMAIWGEGGVATLSMVLFFESCTFPTIFALSVRGLGRHTKRRSSWLVAAVCGAALFPSLTGLLADHAGYHQAMGVPLACFVVVLIFPACLNTAYGKELDGFRETRLGYKSDGAVIDADDSDGTAKPHVTMKESV